MKKIKVFLKPGSSQSKIEEKNGEYIVFVRSKPIENKANIELIEFLAKHFKVSKSQIEIISGHKSRRKIISIS